jgi:hypothetical protein
VLPVALGFFAHGKTWTKFGPWSLGIWFKPACIVSTVGCLALIVIGIQPPNDKALTVLLSTLVILGLVWLGLERRRFKGPPIANLAATAEK